MQSISPNPKKKVVSITKETFDFYEALKRILNGAKVTRKEWDNSKIYMYLRDDYLCVTDPNGSPHNLIVRGVDIGAANDYYEV